MYAIMYVRVGDSPSGKAVGSGPTIRGFESLIPSQNQKKTPKESYFDSNPAGPAKHNRNRLDLLFFCC